MTKMKEYTYPSKEKLKSRTQIKSLFEEGKTLKSYPVIIKYMRIDKKIHQIGVSVSKRNFKKAVDRIAIKRQLREAYRLNKSILTCKSNKYALMIMYVGKERTQSQKIHKKVESLLKNLI